MEGPYQYSLRGRTWENRPDIRIFFWAQIGVLIWIVPASNFRFLIRIIGTSFEKKKKKKNTEKIDFI